MRTYLVSILKLLNKFKYFMNRFCFNLSELARGFGVSSWHYTTLLKFENKKYGYFSAFFISAKTLMKHFIIELCEIVLISWTISLKESSFVLTPLLLQLFLFNFHFRILKMSSTGASWGLYTGKKNTPWNTSFNILNILLCFVKTHVV